MAKHPKHHKQSNEFQRAAKKLFHGSRKKAARKTTHHAKHKRSTTHHKSAKHRTLAKHRTRATHHKSRSRHRARA